jgi:hypothetical protein
MKKLQNGKRGIANGKQRGSSIYSIEQAIYFIGAEPCAQTYCPTPA